MRVANKIPKQRIGKHSEYEYQVHCKTDYEAKRIFKKAKRNLLDVNKWHRLSGLFSGDFVLTDKDGINMYKPAEEGLNIKINMPVPGMIGSRGFDWVTIEQIMEENTEINEWIVVKVRPVKSPDTYENVTTHFFTNEATSNFCVERKNNIVKASIYGRNERPNIYSQNILNRFRNWIVGVSAALGFNAPQWNGLIKGILMK